MTANIRIARAVVAASIGLGGCGPSAGEIRFAKAQQYDADLPDMMEVAKQAGGSNYVIQPLDKPDCPAVAWSECVWRFAAKPISGGAETTAVVELHRSGLRSIMVEVDARDGTQKQADLLLYRIFELGQKYIPVRLSK